MMMLLHGIASFSDNTCTEELKGYKIVPNSRFSFSVDGKKACFFSYYTKELNSKMFASGNRTPGNTLWYGYYEPNKLDKIHHFPKPSDMYASNGICDLDAISFQDINGDNQADVTVIGSCDQNVSHPTVPLVFMRREGEYIFIDNVYTQLQRVRNLTVAEIREFIKYSEYIKMLEGHV